MDYLYQHLLPDLYLPSPLGLGPKASALLYVFGDIIFLIIEIGELLCVFSIF